LLAEIQGKGVLLYLPRIFTDYVIMLSLPLPHVDPHVDLDVVEKSQH
jgi:hypothetical protein